MDGAVLLMTMTGLACMMMMLNMLPFIYNGWHDDADDVMFLMYDDDVASYTQHDCAV